MGFKKEILQILASDAFRCITASDIIQIGQLNAAIALLIKTGIPFDLEYSPGTRRESPATQLTIYIAPTVTVQFVLNFGQGGSVFTNI